MRSACRQDVAKDSSLVMSLSKEQVWDSAQHLHLKDSVKNIEDRIKQQTHSFGKHFRLGSSSCLMSVVKTHISRPYKFDSIAVLTALLSHVGKRTDQKYLYTRTAGQNIHVFVSTSTQIPAQKVLTFTRSSITSRASRKRENMSLEVQQHQQQQISAFQQP